MAIKYPYSHETVTAYTGEYTCIRNLSAILCKALAEELKKVETIKWKEKNIAGFNELNRISKEHGLFSDKYKEF
ncbi:type II toxin-antitoxin system CcdA family antitoxin [Providencia sp. SP181]|uniref:type II toxin-antitoxin system CcdA family antitoxin n=1 Tax=Providencia sp. SP181 TaxID=3136277 RepID=UPI003D26CC18